MQKPIFSVILEEIPLIEHMTKLKESKDQPSNEDKSKDKKKGVRIFYISCHCS